MGTHSITMDPTMTAWTELYKLGGIGAVVVFGGLSVFTWYLKKNLAEQAAMREEQAKMREELQSFNRLLLAMLVGKNQEPKMQELAGFILETEQRRAGR